MKLFYTKKYRNKENISSLNGVKFIIVLKVIVERQRKICYYKYVKIAV